MGGDPIRGCSILVVDDDDTIRHILRRMLEGAGYEVREAPNGKVAIEELSRRPAHVMITDIFMPEQEGIETIRIARKTFPDLGIIAISGAAGENYLKMAELLGASASLLKPFRLKDVLKTVRATLSGRV
ncbi:MAG TPA: response regulator [Bryobacteraceae bacterium]|nr:response regulator [Bryobacteraceae bacterium]HOL72357.1 response regulator [Bryobacteraceae bacterium]HOQ47391.1 response regulator [Bryobacteraceae bacterium]HPQ15581.1 response regulator [Bryobacteraceae bacterium]HPU73145.1 response regulator [Bryobacteraceae bacterium]